MTSELQIRAVEILRESRLFFCFARSWWDGKSIDAVAWWHDTNGCHKRVIYTGESWETKEPVSISEQHITESELTAVVREFDALGIREMPSQSRKLVLTHYDDWYGIRSLDMEQPFWVKIAGGLDAKQRTLILLQHVFRRCPEIAPRG